MPVTPPSIRIGIFGSDVVVPGEKHGSGLWTAGYRSVLTAVEAEPVLLGSTLTEETWSEVLCDLQGILLVGDESTTLRRTADGEKLVEWCAQKHIPLLACDHGLHIMNSTFGGNSFNDLPREQPEALQHRHPPEKGLRHALNILPDTRLCEIYGEGEVVVNSEHRRAVNRVAKNFTVCARALDGIIEAIECSNKQWFALGVQWHPASSTASGLDIQLFRGLVEASIARQQLPRSQRRVAAAA